MRATCLHVGVCRLPVKGDNTIIYMAYKLRYHKENKFFHIIRADFDIERVRANCTTNYSNAMRKLPQTMLPKDFQQDLTYYLLKITKKRKS